MEVNAMLTMRNLGGVALFLFGTTYLWLTPMFAGRGISTKGILWSITQVLRLHNAAGFHDRYLGFVQEVIVVGRPGYCIRSSRAGRADPVLDCGAQQR
jgi:hypothetical protein